MKSKLLAYQILKYHRLGLKIKFKNPEFSFELHHMMNYLKNINAISWRMALDNLKILVYDGLPLSYITKTHPFLNTNLCISPKVLIPRNETEDYIMELITKIKKLQSMKVIKEPIKVLDLCTGSGCISLALACNIEEIEVTAVDKLVKCCINVKTNLNRNIDMIKSMRSSVNVIRRDLFGDFNLNQKFDLIIANPPYIPRNKIQKVDSSVLKFESHTSLFPATCVRNGIHFHTRILNISKTLLKKTDSHLETYLPKIVLEIDGKDQIGPLKRLLKSFHCKKFWFRKDMINIPRSLWIY